MNPFKLIVSRVVETLHRIAGNKRLPEHRVVTFTRVYVLSAASDASVGPNFAGRIQHSMAGVNTMPFWVVVVVVVVVSRVMRIFAFHFSLLPSFVTRQAISTSEWRLEIATMMRSGCPLQPLAGGPIHNNEMLIKRQGVQ